MIQRKYQTSINNLILELHPKEVMLILSIRKIRFGKVEVVMRDGLPAYVDKTTTRDDLREIPLGDILSTIQ